MRDNTMIGEEIGQTPWHRIGRIDLVLLIAPALRVDLIGRNMTGMVGDEARIMSASRRWVILLCYLSILSRALLIGGSRVCKG